MGKTKKVIDGISKAIIAIGIPVIIIMLIFVRVQKNARLLHKEHDYMGYTYYSSILNTDFAESDAEYAFDSILGNEPEYKYLLDQFYNDGYRIYFDDKFTYALMTADLFNSDKFAACVTFDKMTGDIRDGMFVNYENDFFSDIHFFHELSHYVDHKLGNVSQSSEFKEIFESEYSSSTLSDVKYYSDPKEYFAEQSAYLIIYESNNDRGLTSLYGTPQDAPKTFEYIGERLSAMKNMGDK